MSHPLGASRTVVNERYALLTPDSFVPSSMPGWTNCVFHVLISPAMGARFNQHLVTFQRNGCGRGQTGANEIFAYIVDGFVLFPLAKQRQLLKPGSFVYLPMRTEFGFESKGPGTRVLLFEKKYEPLPGVPPPGEVIVGHESKAPGKPFLGDPDARLQALLPDTPAFDMAVNIFTYKPGATLPFVESHIMEHGLLMLRGQGVYRLDADWHPVQAGDVIWMAPYCPQWFVCSGRTPASYIYYKDVNRPPALA
jgi:(S)-ureidoglycine aminohydrolase